MISEFQDGTPRRTKKAEMKRLDEVLRQRRATVHFKSDPVPEDILEEILALSLQAPSGYNLQPWRFIVVRDEANRKKLMEAAMGQKKILEAPVVVIALGEKGVVRDIEEVVMEGVERGAGKREDAGRTMEQARKFLGSFPMDVWVNRHTMIAFTTMMLVAESLGVDTAPMEGFDAASVKKAFGVPEHVEVVALLALGYVEGADKAFPGRYPLSRMVFRESYGARWKQD